MKRIVTLVIIIAFVISGTVAFADTQAGNSSETLWTRTQKADRETGC